MKILVVALFAVLSAPGAVLVWEGNNDTNVIGYNVFISTNYPSKPGPLANAILTHSGGTPRNDRSGFFGFEFVAASDLEVVSLGRWILPGNKHRHVLQLREQNNIIAEVSLATADKVLNQFAYVTLPGPARLIKGSTYQVMSLEEARRDKWYDDAGASVAVNAGLVEPGIRAVSRQRGQLQGSGGKTFGPVDFQARPFEAKWSLLGFTAIASLNLTNVPKGQACAFYVNAVSRGFQTSAPSAIVVWGTNASPASPK